MKKENIPVFTILWVFIALACFYLTYDPRDTSRIVSDVFNSYSSQFESLGIRNIHFNDNIFLEPNLSHGIPIALISIKTNLGDFGIKDGVFIENYCWQVKAKLKNGAWVASVPKKLKNYTATEIANYCDSTIKASIPLIADAMNRKTNWEKDGQL